MAWNSRLARLRAGLLIGSRFIRQTKLIAAVAAGKASLIVETFPVHDAPSRLAYRLTARGRSLGPIMAAIATWGLEQIKGTRMGLQPIFKA